MTINNKINFVYNAFSRHIDRTYELVEPATCTRIITSLKTS